MPRIGLVSDSASAEHQDTLQTILQRRGGVLTDLDRLLLHSEPVARGWHALFGALAGECTLAARTREIALLRVGILTRGRFQFHQHRLIALAIGMSEAEIAALQSWSTSELFSQSERAVLAYTDAMTTAVQVPDTVFDALRVHFSTRQLVELTANSAGYNMVTRFMEAFELVP